MKEFFVTALVLAGIQLGLGTRAQAQSCISHISYCIWDAPLPAGASCYQGESWFCTPCTIPSTACAPPDAPSENPCTACTVGAPIDVATGSTYIDEVDLHLPGLGGGLGLRRRWNSMWPKVQLPVQKGMFGPNWRSNFEERVSVSTDGYINYARGDGSFWSFGYSGNLSWSVVAPARESAILVSGPNFWTITFHNGEQRQFNNTSGSLIAIIDRNGNTTQLAYDSVNRLITVTDPASRHLYFGYQNNTSFLVTSITSDVGIALSYTYDTLGKLTQYTKADQTTVSFQYDSYNNIATVLDANGKVLESHTYNSCGQGLTSSRAGGVDAITLTYATQSCASGFLP
jgi:YD repeat-containing protein